LKRWPVRLRRQAHQDIRDVFEWVLETSRHIQTAENLANRIYDACEALGDFPEKGRLRDDIAVGLRTFAFERVAVIAYRLTEDHVEILNVFYGGRDWEVVAGTEG
jgi:toxin ParE1/3/4